MRALKKGKHALRWPVKAVKAMGAGSQEPGWQWPTLLSPQSDVPDNWQSLHSVLNGHRISAHRIVLSFLKD